MRGGRCGCGGGWEWLSSPVARGGWRGVRRRGITQPHPTILIPFLRNWWMHHISSIVIGSNCLMVAMVCLMVAMRVLTRRRNMVAGCGDWRGGIAFLSFRTQSQKFCPRYECLFSKLIFHFDLSTPPQLLIFIHRYGPFAKHIADDSKA